MRKRELMTKGGAAAEQMARLLLSCAPGDRLPRLHDLADRFGCSNGTLQSALSFLDMQGAAKFEARGRAGTFVLEMDLPTLWSIAGNQFVTIAMPMPYSARYEGLASGLQYSFAMRKIPLTIVFVRGARHRIRIIEQGKADLAVVSGLVANNHPDLEVVWDYGPRTYVGSHAVLLREGVKVSDSGLRVAVDPASYDQQEMVERVFASRDDIEIVSVSYHQLKRLFAQGMIDATVWNSDEVDRTLPAGLTREDVEMDEGSKAPPNTHAVVVRSAASVSSPLAVVEALSASDVLMIADEVETGVRVPSY